MRTYYVYIMASRSGVLYTGVTNDLLRRVNEHKLRYRVTRLVYFEKYAGIRDAIAREQQIKAWNRSRRIDLIERGNGTWQDLAEHWPDRRDGPFLHFFS